MHRRLILSLGFAIAGTLAHAQEPAAATEAEGENAVVEVYEALNLPGIIDIMVLEGAEYGDTLAASMFAGEAVPADWSEQVEAIYDPERMRERVLEALSDSLEGADTAAMLTFLEAEPGRTMAALEASAREALLDDEVEEAAKEAAAVAIAEEDPRVDLLRRYADANDLIETNVVGALNGNYAYFEGMMDGGAITDGATAEDLLADVWAQEPAIRADTTEWVMSFLLLAYGPASDEDIESLIAFSETPEGEVLNAAVFAAFDGVFNDISHDLGLASARYMNSQEL